MRLALPFALFAFMADQLSKWAVVEHMFKPRLGLAPLDLIAWYGDTVRLPYVEIHILPFLNFSMVWNEGIGLGLFNAAGPWALIALSLIICGILVAWMIREPQDHYLHVAIGLMIGGAIGNVVDRARLHAVVDFIDVHIGGWHYPTFNIADSCVVIGVALLLMQPLFTGKVKAT